MTIRTDRPDGASLYDVCVVGAGPLGLAVARQRHKQGQKVILLESGSADQEGNTTAETYGSVHAFE